MSNIQAGQLQLLDILKNDSDLAKGQSLVDGVSGVRAYNKVSDVNDHSEKVPTKTDDKSITFCYPDKLTLCPILFILTNSETRTKFLLYLK